MKKTLLAILIVLGVLSFTSCNTNPKGKEKNETEEVIENDEMEMDEEYNLEENADSVFVNDEDDII